MSLVKEKQGLAQRGGRKGKRMVEAGKGREDVLMSVSADLCHI